MGSSNLGEDIFGKLRTKVTKSSMRSSNLGEDIFGKLRTKSPKVLHEEVQFGEGILGKFRTNVTKSSMSSCNFGWGAGILDYQSYPWFFDKCDIYFAFISNITFSIIVPNIFLVHKE